MKELASAGVPEDKSEAIASASIPSFLFLEVA